MSRPALIPEGHRALRATDVLLGRNAWLIRLRWIAVLATLGFTHLAPWLLPIQIQVGRITQLALALAAYDLAAWIDLRRRLREDAAIQAGTSPPPDGANQPCAPGRWLLPRTYLGTLPYDWEAGCSAVFALLQIVLDLVFLTALLHFTGGIENPAWVFFTFHVIFASVLLSATATYAIASFAVALLCALNLGEVNGWLPHYSLGVSGALYAQPGLIAAYLLLQAATLYTTAYLASSIAARLRRREVDVLMLTRYLGDKAERLEAAYQELSVAEKAKSAYMRKVAHELRQPLGVVKTALSVVLQDTGPELDPQTRSLIERAARRAGGLAEMTQELLSLSRARAGRAAVELTPVEIAGIAARVLDEQHHRAQEAGVSLSVELQIGLPPVIGDAEGLADMMGNLIGNAIRYTPAGGSVWFRARRGADRLVIEVEDTGIGVPAADRDRSFDEFYRTAAAREHSQQGSGLGLAIVKAVVEQHQGTITVEDRDGGGTRFRVELPVLERSDAMALI
ncbi:MAG: HAMP domain-containing histidine kinase [Gemmatimonadetes bacterium]|nr:HAMP domain-containing histidine kinase [Gemmatimonadota bacterium]